MSDASKELHFTSRSPATPPKAEPDFVAMARRYVELADRQKAGTLHEDDETELSDLANEVDGFARSLAGRQAAPQPEGGHKLVYVKRFRTLLPKPIADGIADLEAALREWLPIAQRHLDRILEIAPEDQKEAVLNSGAYQTALARVERMRAALTPGVASAKAEEG